MGRALWFGTWPEIYVMCACCGVILYMLRRIRQRKEVRRYNVVIVGGDSGFGLAMAKAFLRMGDRVLICGTNSLKLQAAQQELQRYGANIFSLACDIRKASDVRGLRKHAVTCLKTVDIWVNNAGVNQEKQSPLTDVGETEMRTVVETNLIGTILCCKEALTLMIKQNGGGHIFNVSGAGGKGQGTPQHAIYGATKAAISQLTQSLASEAHKEVDNVGVHLVSPGVMMPTKILLGASQRLPPSQVRLFNALSVDPDAVAEYLVPRMRITRGKTSTLTYRGKIGLMVSMVLAYVILPCLPAVLLRIFGWDASHRAFSSDGQPAHKQRSYVAEHNLS
ncbi:Chlorophyll b reductase [Pelomyxa schiedti]|nr:Chlorophyll b reductase [Pelomyxa schiedti]